MLPDSRLVLSLFQVFDKVEVVESQESLRCDACFLLEQLFRKLICGGNLVDVAVLGVCSLDMVCLRPLRLKKSRTLPNTAGITLLHGVVLLQRRRLVLEKAIDRRDSISISSRSLRKQFRSLSHSGHLGSIKIIHQKPLLVLLLQVVEGGHAGKFSQR